MKKIFYLTFIAIPLCVFSQGGPPPPGLPDVPAAVPIDQMEYVLLAAGLLLGIYILKKK
jgi:hypothetical protein